MVRCCPCTTHIFRILLALNTYRCAIPNGRTEIRVGHPYLYFESASRFNEENLQYIAPPPFPYATLLRKDEALTCTTEADSAAIAPPDALEMHAEKLASKMLTVTVTDSDARAPPTPVAEHAWATTSFQNDLSLFFL